MQELANFLKVEGLPRSNLHNLLRDFGIYYVDTFADGIQ